MRRLLVAMLLWALHGVAFAWSIEGGKYLIQLALVLIGLALFFLLMVVLFLRKGWHIWAGLNLLLVVVLGYFSLGVGLVLVPYAAAIAAGLWAMTLWHLLRPPRR
jgi:hypothetical protein